MWKDCKDREIETKKREDRCMNIKMLSIYTIVFGFCCILVYSWFLKYDRSFIFRNDGVEQHLSAIAYYGKYLREVAKELFYNHRLAVPLWDFCLGYGSDVFDTLHYYVIGDPFALLSALVPVRYAEYLFCALSILRSFVAGGVFYFFCIHKKCNKYASVIAGLNYAFCGYVLYYGVRHPYFVNAMIFLPLIMIGIDKIFEKKRPTFYILSVAFAAISNFYFFYILCILMVLYAVFQYFAVYGKLEWKNVWRMFLKFAGYFFVAIFIAGISLAPIIYATLNASRIGTEANFSLLYHEFTYYAKLFAGFITTDNSVGLIFGFISLSVPAVVLLFLRKKENKLLKWGYIVTFLLLSLKAAGTIMNGLSYSSLRYCFILSVLVSFTIAKMLPEIMKITEKEKKLLTVISVIYLSMAGMAAEYGKIATSAPVILLTIAMIIVLGGKEQKKKVFGILLLAITCISIGRNAYLYYSEDTGNYIKKDCVGNVIGKITTDSKLALIKKIDDDSFFRSEASDSILNTATAVGVPSTTFYYSLINSSLTDFMDEQGNVLSAMTYKILDTGKRSALNALFSVKYYVKGEKENTVLPYGFDQCVLKQNGYSVYQNRNSLPFGYTYSSVIRKTEYDKLSMVDRQYALLQGAVVEEDNTSRLKTIQVDSNSKKCGYEILASKHIGLEDNRIQIHKAGAMLKVKVKGTQDAELYLSIEGLELSGGKGKSGRASFALMDKDKKVLETFMVRNLDNKFYGGTENFCVNAGYQKADETVLILKFNNTGTFTFSDMSFQAQPMEDFREYIGALQETVLEDVVFDANRISGNIELESDKMLCLSIPYTEGWKAYVDGKQQDTVQIAAGFTGIELEAGKHQIELRYATPFLKWGGCLSIAGIVLLIAVNMFYTRKNRSQEI